MEKQLFTPIVYKNTFHYMIKLDSWIIKGKQPAVDVSLLHIYTNTLSVSSLCLLAPYS